MNDAPILVSLGIANAPEPISHPLVIAYFENITTCVEAANQANLPVRSCAYPFLGGPAQGRIV
jgi:hypothetical protein